MLFGEIHFSDERSRNTRILSTAIRKSMECGYKPEPSHLPMVLDYGSESAMQPISAYGPGRPTSLNDQNTLHFHFHPYLGFITKGAEEKRKWHQNPKKEALLIFSNGISPTVSAAPRDLLQFPKPPYILLLFPKYPSKP